MSKSRNTNATLSHGGIVLESFVSIRDGQENLKKSIDILLRGRLKDASSSASTGSTACELNYG